MSDVSHSITIVPSLASPLQPHSSTTASSSASSLESQSRKRSPRVSESKLPPSPSSRSVFNPPHSSDLPPSNDDFPFLLSQCTTQSKQQTTATPSTAHSTPNIASPLSFKTGSFIYSNSSNLRNSSQNNSSVKNNEAAYRTQSDDGIAPGHDDTEDDKNCLVQSVDSSWYSTIICIVIVVHVLYVAVETEYRFGKVDATPEEYYNGIWIKMIVVNMVFSVIYTIDLFLCLTAKGFAVIHDHNHVFDFFTCILSIASDVAGWQAISTQSDSARDVLQVLGMIRLLRVVRFVGNKYGIFVIVRGFMFSILSLAWIAVFLFILLYAFANLASRIFHGILLPNKDPEIQFYWGSLSSSIYTLFLMLSFDGWSDVAQETQIYYNWSPVFFVLYVALTGILVLNIVTSVMVDSYINASKALQTEEQYRTALKNERAATEAIRQAVIQKISGPSQFMDDGQMDIVAMSNQRSGSASLHSKLAACLDIPNQQPLWKAGNTPRASLDDGLRQAYLSSRKQRSRSSRTMLTTLLQPAAGSSGGRSLATPLKSSPTEDPSPIGRGRKKSVNTSSFGDSCEDRNFNAAGLKCVKRPVSEDEDRRSNAYSARKVVFNVPPVSGGVSKTDNQQRYSVCSNDNDNSSNSSDSTYSSDSDNSDESSSSSSLRSSQSVSRESSFIPVLYTCFDGTDLDGVSVTHEEKRKASDNKERGSHVSIKRLKERRKKLKKKPYLVPPSPPERSSSSFSGPVSSMMNILPTMSEVVPKILKPSSLGKNEETLAMRSRKALGFEIPNNESVDQLIGSASVIGGQLVREMTGGVNRQNDVKLSLKDRTAESVMEILTPALVANNVNLAEPLEALKLMKQYGFEEVSASDFGEAVSWIGDESTGRQLLVSQVERRSYFHQMQYKIDRLEAAAAVTDKLVEKLAQNLLGTKYTTTAELD